MAIFLNNNNSCDSLGRVKALSAALQKQKASCTHSSSVWFCIIVASSPLLLRTKEASPAHPSSQMYRCTWGWVPDPQEVIFCLSFLRHCPQERPPPAFHACSLHVFPPWLLPSLCCFWKPLHVFCCLQIDLPPDLTENEVWVFVFPVASELSLEHTSSDFRAMKNLINYCPYSEENNYKGHHKRVLGHVSLKKMNQGLSLEVLLEEIIAELCDRNLQKSSLAGCWGSTEFLALARQELAWCPSFLYPSPGDLGEGGPRAIIGVHRLPAACMSVWAWNVIICLIASLSRSYFD